MAVVAWLGLQLDRVESTALLFALDDLRGDLIDQLLLGSVIPARANQRIPATRIVDAFLRGLGPWAGAHHVLRAIIPGH